MDPLKAMAVISANPDDLLANERAWSELTPQIFDEGLAPRIIPLLAARCASVPADWTARIMLAQYEIFVGDTQAATRDLQYIYEQREPTSLNTAGAASSGTTDSSLADRMEALDLTSLWNVRHPLADDPFRQVKSLQNARDYAFVCLAGLANERGEGAKFLQNVKTKDKADEGEWMTALMLLNSQGLILRELHSYLASGPEVPNIDILAYRWLKAHRNSGRGFDYGSEQLEKSNLLQIFQKRVDAIPQQGHVQKKPAPDELDRSILNSILTAPALDAGRKII